MQVVLEEPKVSCVVVKHSANSPQQDPGFSLDLWSALDDSSALLPLALSLQVFAKKARKLILCPSRSHRLLRTGNSSVEILLLLSHPDLGQEGGQFAAGQMELLDLKT